MTTQTLFRPSAPARSRGARWISNATTALIGLIGVAAFLYPFFLPGFQQRGELAAHADDALLIFAALIVLSLTVIFAELESGSVGGASSKTVAVLGVLTAINATLRLVDVGTAALNLGGVSPIFFLVILCGYVYGGRFGFLLGALTMAVGAILTGGVGPWLPYQMFGVGWVGLTAGWLPSSRLRGPRRLKARGQLTLEIAVLAAFGFTWGLLYGAILNLYFWPYAVGSAGYWAPGMSWHQVLVQYTLFYATTSLWWDLVRAVGNAALILLFGAAVLKVLRRFQRRFSFETI
ncbi:MAG: ECF transporter S component [Ardenticatenaceae bacterium]|nr:ECF transporter S component [Ardenticatenaceae bacterium]HBY95248.1 ECF transporter S component [Chloroflexota bacterium]